MQEENNNGYTWRDMLRKLSRECAGDMPGKGHTAGKDEKDGMDGLLEKIFKEVIYLEDDIVQMENVLAVEIDGLVDAYPGVLSEEEKEMFRAVIYEAVFAAETKTFWLGVRYAYRMSKWL